MGELISEGSGLPIFALPSTELYTTLGSGVNVDDAYRDPRRRVFVDKAFEVLNRAIQTKHSLPAHEGSKDALSDRSYRIFPGLYTCISTMNVEEDIPIIIRKSGTDELPFIDGFITTATLYRRDNFIQTVNRLNMLTYFYPIGPEDAATMEDTFSQEQMYVLGANNIQEVAELGHQLEGFLQSEDAGLLQRSVIEYFDKKSAMNNSTRDKNIIDNAVRGVQAYIIIERMLQNLDPTQQSVLMKRLGLNYDYYTQHLQYLRVTDLMDPQTEEAYNEAKRIFDYSKHKLGYYIAKYATHWNNPNITS